MAIAVLMPELGESVDEATITQWLKSVGDEVKEFEPLLEVNTDKVDTEIPSPVGGVILKILSLPDQTVHAGTTLAWIGAPGEVIPDDDTPTSGGSPSTQPPALQPAVVQTAQPGVPAPRESPAAPAATYQNRRPGRDRDLGFISPVVARMANEHDLNLSLLRGTGLEGRITKLDVLAFLEKRPSIAPPRIEAPHQQVETTPMSGELIKMTPMRKSIAEHMVMSKRTSPHVTTVMEADMSRVVAHRAEHKAVFAREQVNLTYTAYFIAAIAAALKFHPNVNSSWTDAGIQLHPQINIGMATSLEPEGLIVPVIKGADDLSLLGLARSINDLAHRARTKQLQPDDVRGGTFTLTNHGTSGSLFANPIINQPQCGILGVGLMEKRVVVINDAIAIRPMVYISLTFDHRILDGATADYFLARVKSNLENW